METNLNSQVIEDEIHFLYLCSVLDQIRDCFLINVKANNRELVNQSDIELIQHSVGWNYIRQFIDCLEKMY